MKHKKQSISLLEAFGFSPAVRTHISEQKNSFTDEEAADAVEINVVGEPVEKVVNFLNSPLGREQKVREFLGAGLEDGKPGDESVDVTYEQKTASDLVPSQNEIDLMKSVSWPLSSTKALKNMMNNTVKIGVIVVSKNDIIDGHHRWSSMMSVNPDSKLEVVDLKIGGHIDKKLGIVQAAIAAQPEVHGKKLPASVVSSVKNNILDKSATEIEKMILGMVGKETQPGIFLGDEIVNLIISDYPDEFGLRGNEDKNVAIKKIAKKVGQNLSRMKSSKGPTREYMPQLDGGSTGPRLDPEQIVATIKSGQTNFKNPIVKEGASVVDRWKKLAGIF